MTIPKFFDIVDTKRMNRRRCPFVDQDRWIVASKVYMMSRDVEGRWMDLHERETGIKAPID